MSIVQKLRNVGLNDLADKWENAVGTEKCQIEKVAPNQFKTQFGMFTIIQGSGI